jgi:proteic killer suppression protein
LKVDFLDARAKAFLEDTKQVRKAHGAVAAKKLQQRLDDLEAAASMEVMRSLPGHWEELKHDRAGQFSAHLDGGLRLIVKPQQEPPPTKTDGGLDWSAIDAVFILEVVDYHD